jgi:hypothetical protein
VLDATDYFMTQQRAIEAKSSFSLGDSLAKAAIGLFSIETQTIVPMLTKAIDSITQDVVWNYVNGRDKLRQSFETGLDELRKWLIDQAHELDHTAIPIAEPRQSVMDILGPDFRYENVANENHDPGTFGPAVERERREYVDEQPGGPISQRLAGER